jgi:NTE family protein
MDRCIFVIVLLFVTGCTAHFPVNPPLERYQPNHGYRLKNLSVPGNSEELLFIVAFSGGGTRSSALAYGVLEQLAATTVTINGRQRRLLDEVDVISGVSGGGFTAAYYGLYGDRIFQDFEQRFLNRNIDKGLTAQLFSPVNWARLVSASFSRSDLAARYFDKHVFDGKTFADIAARKGPAIIINATDMSLGTQFAFLQSQFDYICSDVAKFSVARALTASSAIPVAFTPITLRNYAGTCAFRPPHWFLEALNDGDRAGRRFELADRLSTYLDSRDRAYVHLVDGGLSDYLGVRGPIDRVILFDDAVEAMHLDGSLSPRKLLFIVVNAESLPHHRWDRQLRAPKLNQVLTSTTSLAISRSNFETMELIKQMLDQWREQMQKQCNQPSAGHIRSVTSCTDVATYLVEVNFDRIADERERAYLRDLERGFKLPDGAVERLRQAGRTVLSESAVYQRFLSDLR